MSPKTKNPWDLDPPPRYNETISNDYHTLPPNRRHSHPDSIGWKHIEHPSPTGHFWPKSVRDPISSSLLQVHYGISKSQRDPNGPDCFFNCNLLPRTPDISKENIAIMCIKIARRAREHRAYSKEYCDCTFLDLRKGECEKGGRWAFRLFGWVDALLVRWYMRQHDSLCTCQCFDVRVLDSELPRYSSV
jgi:hypothetical protein